MLLLFQKYRIVYDPVKLVYNRVYITPKERIKLVFLYLLYGVVFGFIFMMVGFHLIDSPKEHRLKGEIKQYRRQVRQLNDRVDRCCEVLADLESRDDNLYRIIFAVQPISPAVRSSGIGGASRYDDLNGFECSKELISTTRKVDDLTKRLYVQSCSLDDVYKMAVDKQARMTCMPAIMPLPKNQCKIVSGFGIRYHPILRYSRMHTGIDLTAREGTSIYATADGKVTVAGRNSESLSGYGVVCVIDHGYGFQTLYAHMNQVSVQVGQSVKRGEMIGTVGSTGLSQGPHLHYEVLQNGNRVNPVYFFFNDLTPEEYDGVIEEANKENQCLS